MERRILCPNCGARPTRTSFVMYYNEIVEERWRCPDCTEAIERETPSPPRDGAGRTADAVFARRPDRLR